MTLITKPDFTYVWASGGAVVAPNDTKKQQGWVAEAPPFQYDNWLQNRQDQMLAHINQRGIPAWDGWTNYEAGGLSYVQGSDGKIYKSVAASGPASVVSNPTTDISDTYWTIAFSDVGAFLTETSANTLYLRQDQNGADADNAATFRTNIGVVVATETQAGLLEIATALEAQTFTANKAIDGAKLTDAFKGANSSLSTNGYQKLPSGLIIQWGQITGSYNANTFSFPLAFPTACLSCGVMNVQAEISQAAEYVQVYDFTATTVKAVTYTNIAPGDVAGNLTFGWLALGY